MLALLEANARPVGVSSVDAASYIESKTGIKPALWVTQGMMEALWLSFGVKQPEYSDHPVPIYDDITWFDRDFEEIPADEILAKIQNNTPVEYDHIAIRGDLDLRQLDLAKKRIGGSNLSIVTTPISITHSIMFGNVLFNNTLFDKSVDFSWSKFIEISDFDGSKFNSTSNFNISDFCGNAHFSDSIFNNAAGFVLSNFRNYAIFRDCTFNGTTNFVSSNFSSVADFSGTLFKGNANFVDSEFSSDAYFSGCRFGKDAIFGLTKKMDAWIYVSDDPGLVSYYWYDITGLEVVSHIRNDSNNYIYRFKGVADFSSSVFEGYADFSKRQFSGVAYFNDSTFRNVADFNTAVFDEYANFHNAKILGFFNFTKIKLGDLGIHWPYATHFASDDGPTYLYLIKYFRDSEQYGVADEIYFRYRAWRQDQRPWSDWYKYFDIFALYTCGYGVRVDYTIRLAVIMLLSFGLVYFWISKSKNLNNEKNLQKLNQSLWLSLVILLSAPKDLYPLGDETYEKYIKHIKYWPIIERLIGWGFCYCL